MIPGSAWRWSVWTQDLAFSNDASGACRSISVALQRRGITYLGDVVDDYCCCAVSEVDGSQTAVS